MDASAFVKSFVALFAIVDPFAALPMFAVLVGAGAGASEKLRMAKRVATTVFITLLLAAVFGRHILSFFSIGIPAFRVGGGILLLLMAISMLNADSSKFRMSPDEGVGIADGNSIVPLGIPLLAGPAAISHVIIQAHSNSGVFSWVATAGAILLVSVGVLLVFVLGSRLMDRLGSVGIGVMTRVMGLILAAMSVEIIGDGLSSMFPRLFGH